MTFAKSREGDAEVDFLRSQDECKQHSVMGRLWLSSVQQRLCKQEQQDHDPISLVHRRGLADVRRKGFRMTKTALAALSPQRDAPLAAAKVAAVQDEHYGQCGS